MHTRQTISASLAILLELSQELFQVESWVLRIRNNCNSQKIKVRDTVSVNELEAMRTISKPPTRRWQSNSTDRAKREVDDCF